MEQKQNVEQGAGGKGLDDYLRAGSPGVLITVCALLLAALGGLFAPVFTRAFTDDILTSNRLSWYPGILYAFAGLIVFQTVAAEVHQITVTRAAGRVALRSNAAYMRHLLRLPISFFARRKAGDLANRQEENDTVANTLIGVLVPMASTIPKTEQTVMTGVQMPKAAMASCPKPRPMTMPSIISPTDWARDSRIIQTAVARNVFLRMISLLFMVCPFLHSSNA